MFQDVAILEVATVCRRIEFLNNWVRCTWPKFDSEEEKPKSKIEKQSIEAVGGVIEEAIERI